MLCFVPSEDSDFGFVNRTAEILRGQWLRMERQRQAEERAQWDWERWSWLPEWDWGSLFVVSSGVLIESASSASEENFGPVRCSAGLNEAGDLAHEAYGGDNDATAGVGMTAPQGTRVGENAFPGEQFHASYRDGVSQIEGHSLDTERFATPCDVAREGAEEIGAVEGCAGVMTDDSSLSLESTVDDSEKRGARRAPSLSHSMSAPTLTADDQSVLDGPEAARHIFARVPRQFVTGVRNDVYQAHAPTTPYVEYLGAMQSTESVAIGDGAPAPNSGTPLHPTRVVKRLRRAMRRKNVVLHETLTGNAAPSILRGAQSGRVLGADEASRHGAQTLYHGDGRMESERELLRIGRAEGAGRKILAGSLQPSVSSELYTIASAVSGGAVAVKTAPPPHSPPAIEDEAHSYPGTLASTSRLTPRPGLRQREGEIALRASASASSRAGQGTTMLHFRRGRSARVLDLRYYQVGDRGAQKLADTIRRHQGRIETLVLRENNIRGRGAIALCGALTAQHRCRKLDFSRNRIGVDGCRALAKAFVAANADEGVITTTMSSQENLQARHREDQVIHDSTIWRQDTQGTGKVPYSCCIPTPTVQCGAAGDQSARLGAQTTLAPLAWLRELDLSNNHMSSRATTILLECIVTSANKSLTRLDLSHNELASRCCLAVASLIRHEYAHDHDTGTGRTNLAVPKLGGPTSKGPSASPGKGGLRPRGLLFLDLSWNMLKAVDAPILMAAIASTKSLRFINLAFNRLGDPGAAALAAALRTNATLEEVDLSYNGISSLHCNDIASAILENTRSTLRLLELHGNVIGTSDLEILHNALAKYA